MPTRGNADAHDGIGITVTFENHRFIDVIGQGTAGSPNGIPDVVGGLVDFPP